MGRRHLGIRLHPANPVVDFLLYLVLGIPVARLDLALELLAVAVDLRDVVVGELAPLLLNFAGDLFPIAFDAVPIHWMAPQLELKLRLKPYNGTPSETSRH